MDPEERLAALKRAYADIILNTAKEAAARIMVSERKAVGFQHELNAAKEQALQTLLRLKQMMDSKGGEPGMIYFSQQKMIEELKAQLQEAENTISEAEMTSLSQQKKIEELEAQLEEAEDIVKDVREELRELQAELESARSTMVQDMAENDTVTLEQTSQANKLITSQSVAFPPAESQLEPFTKLDTKNSGFNQGYEHYECCSVNDSLIANSRIGKPDLLSTSEENRPNDSHSILSSHPELRLEFLTPSDMKNSASNQRKEVYKGYGNANGFGMGNSNIRKPEVPSAIMKNNESAPYRNRRTQRIRAFEEKLMAGELAYSETTDNINYEASGREDGEDEGIRKTSRKKKEKVHDGKGQNQVQKVMPFRRKRRTAVKYKKIKTLSSRNLFNEALENDLTISCAETSSVNIASQSCGDPSNMALISSADAEHEDPPIGGTKIAESVAEIVNAIGVETPTNKDKASIDELLLKRNQSGHTDSSGVMISRMDVEKADVPVVSLQTKMSGLTNVIPNLPLTDSRVIKYTFQRKRKRQPLINGNASLGESNSMEKVAEKQTVTLET